VTRLADYPDDLREARAELTRLRAFSLSLPVPQCRDSVIRPLLALASDCFVYGLERGSRLEQLIRLIVTQDKGKWRLCLDREAITGYELLWCAGLRGCGTILILVPFDLERLEPILRHGFGPQLVSNIGSGHTRSAIQFARRATADGRSAAFAFPGSNGIEHLDVFARQDVLERLFMLAAETCVLTEADAADPPASACCTIGRVGPGKREGSEAIFNKGGKRRACSSAFSARSVVGMKWSAVSSQSFPHSRVNDDGNRRSGGPGWESGTSEPHLGNKSQTPPR